ncbi:hypothetical protein [Blastopirellula marina]|uniref:Uncharacterized protein n=1 Tax=Blastopirellula marina TaxID=124 RepID=A0A2S8GPM9_9BACT|nr:hypothetical protein [Blastopirellula marina]PQO46380.1 hypothetical protein C5Y93_10385 [Blastopirellula marina]
MNLEDSPYRSPQLEDSGDPADAVIAPLKWMMGAVLFALLFYVLAYVGMFVLISVDMQQLEIDRPSSDPFWNPIANQIRPWVLILNPLAILLGMIATLLIWKELETWSGVLIMTLLSLIPILSVAVLLYSLWRGAHEIHKIQRANQTKEKATV